MASGELHEIADFEVGLPDGWYPMPLDPGDERWAAELAEQTAPADAGPEIRDALTEELAIAQRNFASMDDPLLRAAVWIHDPGSGHASAAMVFSMAEISELGSADEFERELAAYAGTGSEGGYYYSVTTWQADIDAGRLVGSHNFIAHPGADDESGSMLEERVVIAVYPRRAAQAVQFIFSAEGLGSYLNMAEETTAFVSTLSVRLDAAA